MRSRSGRFRRSTARPTSIAWCWRRCPSTSAIRPFFQNSMSPAPLAISHQAQFPAISLSFNLAPGAALGDAVEEVRTIETQIGMPTSIVGLFAGDAAEFSKSLAGQPWLILAALVTIYIVLGVLYESYIHPITILSTLPSAGVGAI